MSERTYFHRTRISTAQNRGFFIAAALGWTGALFFLVFGGIIMIPAQFSSPANGFLAAIGAATFAIAAYSWNRTVGLNHFSMTFIYRDHARTRYRTQWPRLVVFPENPEFRIYSFLGLKRAYLRISGKGPTRWVYVGNSSGLKEALTQAGFRVTRDLISFALIVYGIIALALTSIPIFLLICGSVGSILYAKGVFDRDQPHPTSGEPNPHGLRQMRILAHTGGLLTGLWALLVAMQLPLSTVDQTFFSLQAAIRKGNYENTIPKIIRFAEETEFGRHLNWSAWVLTTVPDLTYRNYAKAREFAERSLLLSPSISAQDTLACSLMGSGARTEALALAEKADLKRRAQDFSEGKLCEDPLLYPEGSSVTSAPAARGLASEKPEKK